MALYGAYATGDVEKIAGPGDRTRIPNRGQAQRVLFERVFTCLYREGRGGIVKEPERIEVPLPGRSLEKNLVKRPGLIHSQCRGRGFKSLYLHDGTRTSAPDTPNSTPIKRPHLGRLLGRAGSWHCTRHALCNALSPPNPEARSRSVSPRSCPGGLHALHMQKLSRSPQIVPINDKPLTERCWSAACAYARGGRKRRPMVAGVHDHHAPSGPKPDITAGHQTCTMQPPRRCTTQCRRFHIQVPRNPLGPLRS